MPPSVCIADHSHLVCDWLAPSLAEHGIESQCFPRVSELVERLPHLDPSCAIVEADVADVLSFEVLETIHFVRPQIAVFVTYRRRDLPVKMAVLAMRFGARDVIQIPEGTARLVTLVRSLG